MPATPTNQRMGELHEIYLAEINDGRKSKASGSQWTDQGDGRNAHDRPFSFCWDGKATRGEQVAVTRKMIAKIREQAHGERLQIGLRWYGNDTLTQVDEDLVAVQGSDWEEVLAAAREAAGLREELERLREQLEAARTDRDEAQAERDRLREQMQQPEPAVRIEAPSEEMPRVPGYIPQLPWVVISLATDTETGMRRLTGMRYDETGHQHAFDPGQVRVERTVRDRPRLVADDIRIDSGELWVDGVLRARAWPDYPEREIG